MYKLNKQEMPKIAPLFDGWNETLIWSCLQGCMGNAWVDNIENPKSAQIVIADFCFFAGIPDVELVKNIPTDYPRSYIEMVPQSEAWAKLIEQVYKDKAEKQVRYSIKKEHDVLNIEKLRTYVEELPSEYRIREIDEELYHKLQSEQWSDNLCAQFEHYDTYKKHGLGFVVLYAGSAVCGASSYTYYTNGIEIEIDTKREYRRKGLALACASRLILECLERGLYPSWDAANKASVALSEKLGYHFDKEYDVYDLTIR